MEVCGANEKEKTLLQWQLQRHTGYMHAAKFDSFLMMVHVQIEIDVVSNGLMKQFNE